MTHITERVILTENLYINTLKDFITQMPKDLPNIITKARFLYLELGKRSFYDRRILTMMFGEEEDWEYYRDSELTNPNMVTCGTLMRQYKILLDSCSIKSKLERDEFGHFALFFVDENNVMHQADLTNDLKNIQFNCKTSYFGKDTISEKSLREIDINLGYIDKNRGYADDGWNLFRTRLTKSKLEGRKRLEAILQGLGLFGDLSKLGTSELFNLYQKFAMYCNCGQSKISFYSQMYSESNIEDFFVELRENEIRTTYKLDLNTRTFQLFSQKEYEELQI